MSSYRDIDATLLATLESGEFTPVILVEITLDDITIRWHSSTGDLVCAGDTYLGTGLLGEVASLDESATLQPTSVKMTVSGLDTSLLSLVMNNTMQNRPVILRMGALDTDGALVGTPMIFFDGKLRGGPEIQIGETIAIRLTAVDALVDWERKLNSRLNNVTQQAVYPGDRGLEYVDVVSKQSVAWPGAHYWKHQK